MEKNKLALKLSALAGVAVSATSSTQAAVVLSPTIGSGIKPPSSAGSFDWDVDGDSVIDFRLFNGNPPYSSSSGGGGNEANFDDANGGRLVGAVGSSSSFSTSGVRHDGIQKLGAGFVVGAVMPGYGFKNGPQASVTITNNGATGGDAVDQGWNIGDTGYFGFKFTTGASTFYGWGTLSITGSPVGQGFTILNAYYENTPDASITVGNTSAIPEPASSAALLALGAAGVAAWRRRRTAV